MHRLLVTLLPWAAAALAPEPCSSGTLADIRRTLGDITDATNCPRAVWKPQFFRSRAIQERETPVVIFDIGCNKGFDAIHSLNLFTKDFALTAQRWARETGFPCGICDQCKDAGGPRQFWTQPKAVQLYCAEPLPANFQVLNATAARLRLQDRGLHLVYGAFTSLADAKMRGWTAEFPVGANLTGAEGVGIGFNGDCLGCPTHLVPLHVLDHYVRAQQLPAVDLLSVDTEGNDVLVLLGAAHTLRRVKYVEFEYHSRGAWRSHQLRDVLHTLEGEGFVCYWLGKAKLWRITGCWDDRYAQHCWSNIGCVQHQEPEWLAIMENIFQRTVRKGRWF